MPRYRTAYPPEFRRQMDGIPIVIFGPATKADLKPGATVFVPAKRGADGALSAETVSSARTGSTRRCRTGFVLSRRLIDQLRLARTDEASRPPMSPTWRMGTPRYAGEREAFHQADTAPLVGHGPAPCGPAPSARSRSGSVAECGLRKTGSRRQSRCAQPLARPSQSAQLVEDV
jgi:hypothetical protein